MRKKFKHCNSYNKIKRRIKITNEHQQLEKKIAKKRKYFNSNNTNISKQCLYY